MMQSACILLFVVFVACTSAFQHIGVSRISRTFTCHQFMIFASVDSALEVPQEVDVPSSALAAPRKDSPLERVVIILLSWLLARLIDDEVIRVEAMSKLRFNFDGFCDVTKILLRSAGTRPEVVKIKIVALLTSLMPVKVREFFKEAIKQDPKLLCEQSSEWIGFGFISWLIGDTERISVNIPKESMPELLDNDVTWQSGTKLTECRFLQESGCKSTCLHLCKMPTQAFFNEELGLPLRMTPNFDDCSCTFEFGLSPLPVEEDPAFSTPCWATCSLAKEKEQGLTAKCN